MNRNLIVYFSRSGNNYVSGRIVNLEVGNTKIAAKMIQDITGGELFEIVPVEKYSDDYDACTREAKAHLNANARPDFVDPLDDIAEYDTIYVGYPNYWGTMPVHVMTFLERYDFSGKTIKPFCTHEGSGLGHSVSDIKKMCPRAMVEKGLAITGSTVKNSRKVLEKWI
ncbi:MAG: flavodoxin [Erysipelotrichaceae bacterium]|nr:flavodoxin [Erysipelotrichaceae bacterium]MDD3809294.1 flavodoxin [Erysipelotrichaceae bacterium]